MDIKKKLEGGRGGGGCYLFSALTSHSNRMTSGCLHCKGLTTSVLPRHLGGVYQVGSIISASTICNYVYETVLLHCRKILLFPAPVR